MQILNEKSAIFGDATRHTAQELKKSRCETERMARRPRGAFCLREARPRRLPARRRPEAALCGRGLGGARPRRGPGAPRVSRPERPGLRPGPRGPNAHDEPNVCFFGCVCARSPLFVRVRAARFALMVALTSHTL